MSANRFIPVSEDKPRFVKSGNTWGCYGLKRIKGFWRDRLIPTCVYGATFEEAWFNWKLA